MSSICARCSAADRLIAANRGWLGRRGLSHFPLFYVSEHHARPDLVPEGPRRCRNWSIVSLQSQTPIAGENRSSHSSEKQGYPSLLLLRVFG